MSGQDSNTDQKTSRRQGRLSVLRCEVMKVRTLALAIDIAAINGGAGLFVVSADGVAFEGCCTSTISFYLVTEWGSRTPAARVSVGIVREWHVVRWWHRVLMNRRYLEVKC